MFNWFNVTILGIIAGLCIAVPGVIIPLAKAVVFYVYVVRRNENFELRN